MKKTIKIFGLIYLFCFIFIKVNYAQTCNDRAYYILKESTVSILIQRTDNKYAGCTGIIIHKDTSSTGILTANHCIENAEKIFIDSVYTVVKYIKSNQIDVAYLIINDVILHKNPVKLARYNPSANEIIYTLGYPGIFEIFNCSPILFNGLKNIYTNAKIIPGCSGSGVINVRGELVGIMWGRYINSIIKKDVSVFVSIEQIKKFLQLNNVIKNYTILIK